MSEHSASVPPPASDYGRDAERLLGSARMVLDLAAEVLAGRDERREQSAQECADMAQRIVDLIGHPVTDEAPITQPGRIHVHKTTVEVLPDDGLDRTLDGDVRDLMLDRPLLSVSVVVDPAITGKVDVRTYHSGGHIGGSA